MDTEGYVRDGGCVVWATEECFAKGSRFVFYLLPVLDSCTNLLLLSIFVCSFVTTVGSSSYFSLFISFLANLTHLPFQVLSLTPQIPTAPLSIRLTLEATNELFL